MDTRDLNAIKIPGYKIEGILGKGGMAVVYLAIQDIFERQVALKVMDVALSKDPSFGQRFMREAKIVAQLTHPNIVSVYDVGLCDGIYYLSMEYIQGQDLKVARANLSVSDKIQVIKQVASALSFAHKKGYVHRDIKPENILIRAENGDTVLMDFGIARSAQLDLNVTQTGMALGTPHYMSPEQARGEDTDPRADLYSLGVLFYFLLVGRVPYQGDSAVAIGVKHLTEPLPQLPMGYEKLQPLLDRLMAKSVEQRCQSADELLIALDHLDIDALTQSVVYAEKSRRLEGDKTEPCTPVDSLDHSSGENPTEIHAGGLQPSEQMPSFLQPTAKKRFTRTIWLVTATVLMLPLLVFGAYKLYKSSSATGQSRSTNELVASGAEFILPSLPALRDSPEGADHVAEKINSGLKGFAARLKGESIDGPTIEERAAKLRRIAASQGEQGSTRQRLNSLAEEAFSVAQVQLSRGHWERGKELYSRYKTLFPNYWRENASRHDDIRVLLDNERKLKTLQKSVASALENNQLIGDGSNNALPLYIEILKLDRDNQFALFGLARLSQKLEGLAEESYESGSWGQAYAYAKAVKYLHPRHYRATEMMGIIERYQQEENDVQAWLQQAREHRELGQFYSPPSSNAFLFYQRILELRNDHAEAKEELREVEQEFVQKIHQLIKENEMGLAFVLVEDAIELAGDLTSLQGLQTLLSEGGSEASLNELSPTQSNADQDQRVEQDRPANETIDGVISKKPSESAGQPIQKGFDVRFLVVSDQPIDRLDDVSQSRFVKSTKTLFGTFSYEGFVGNTLLLHARLVDKKNRLIEQVPIVISAPSGVLRFRMDRALRRFGDGQYRLHIVNPQEDILVESEFRIKD